jgi:hypothetical protein
MISLTLVTAVGVKLTGNLGVVSTFGVIVVAIVCISLKLTGLISGLIIHRLLLILLGFLWLDEPADLSVAQFSAQPVSFAIQPPPFAIHSAVRPIGNSRKYWILPPRAGL